MKRTAFQNFITASANKVGMKSLKDLSDKIGMPYQTMQRRIRDPRSLRMYELIGLIDSLGLVGEDQDQLIESIRG